MVSIENFRQLALSFEETDEVPHFDKTSFRVKNKIFATFDKKLNRACLKLTTIDQSVFTSFDPKAVYPVPNKWGKQGWTFVELDRVHNDLFTDALRTSYCETAPKKLAEKYRA